MYNRIFTIVIDSVGVGELPDSHIYGDKGTNTIKNASYSKADFKIPTLDKLGIGLLTDINNTKNKVPGSIITKLSEQSVGKDTTTGHWELMGLVTSEPFVTFTDTGFPKELINEIEVISGRTVIGNKAASGTEIIKELGEIQYNTGALIVYTSADSVLQIAANEEIIPLEELYDICKKVRKITLDNEKWKVGRIIARPFIGTNKSNFERTTNRHDYSVKPPKKTVLNLLKENNYDVVSVGKINDIFDGEGITQSYSSKSNKDGMKITIDLLSKPFKGLCFLNLVDFDALYGHRRDPDGYANCLEEFDKQLDVFIRKMKEEDLLIITADHGNDPLHKGTDHTREYVPCLIYSKNISGKIIEERSTFSDLGQTILNNFNIQNNLNGKSIL